MTIINNLSVHLLQTIFREVKAGNVIGCGGGVLKFCFAFFFDNENLETKIYERNSQ